MRRFFPVALILSLSLGGVTQASAESVIRREPTASGAGFRLVETRRSLGTIFERYQRTVEGVPVLGADVVVTEAPGRVPPLILGRKRLKLSESPTSDVRSDQALAEALRHTRVTALRAPAVTELAILPSGSTGRLVWRVLLPTGEPFASLEVLVDAHSGRVVKSRDLLVRATGTGRIFEPNAVTAIGSRDGLADDNDADTDALTAARTSVVLRRLEDGTNCLSGRWAQATLRTGPVCIVDRDFGAITRGDDRFEAIMAYFHVDRAQAYLQSLGFDDVNDRRTHLRANDFDADASFFDPITKEIYLGTGGVDDGEDADIILHEYGHAIQDDQAPGFGSTSEGRALAEGFGDYFAASLFATFAPNRGFDECVGEWDALGFDPPSECLRRVDKNLRLSQVGPGTACDGKPHCVGEVWSSALWTIRGQIGGPAADRIVIQSHFSLASSSGFQDSSRALLAADNALYGGRHYLLLRDVLEERELVDISRLDTDGDVVKDIDDNCPLTSNAKQLDWDVDGRGDACDRSARAYIRRIRSSGLAIRMVGATRPDYLKPGTWHVRVHRRTCEEGLCRYRFAKEVAGQKRLENGRIVVNFHVSRAGTYRFRAILRHPRFVRARSEPVVRRISS